MADRQKGGHLAKDRILVALDIGTTKVALLVGEVQDKNIKIIGNAMFPSLGMKRGVVVDLEKTIYSIETAIEKAEKMADLDIDSAYISIGGSHIQSLNNKGIVAISSPSKEVSQEDIDRVIETAKTFNLAPTRRIIHVIPREYTVDEQRGIRDPLGMAGSRLGVEVHIVSGQNTTIQNLLKCTQNAGIRDERLVLQSIASAEAILTDDEKELGTALVDIGGGTTDIAIYLGGSIIYSSVIPMGGEHVTNDIAIGLRTPIEEAEKLKIKKGYAISDNVDENDKIEIPSPGGEGVTISTRKQLCEIIQPRMEEIYSLVKRSIAESSCSNNLSGGVVITGGGSELSGNLSLAEKVLGLPVRAGKPGKSISTITDDIISPKYSTAAGLLLYGLKSREEFYDDNLTGGILDAIISRLKSIFTV